jgi:peroxiredoxin Q/BCP
MSMPKKGDTAPAFSTLDDRGQSVSLSDFRGRWVVLFFYPKDDTPGCTIEACSFRDTYPTFEGLDAVVLGLSPDSPQSHAKFKVKYGLPMTLLADENHAIAETYGVWVEKNIFGVTRMGIARTTFLVDPNGKIARVFEKVDPSGHGEDLAQVIASAKAAA